MIQDLMSKYNIDADGSYMLGDKTIDAECGNNANIKGIVVRQEDQKKDHPFYKTLLDFAKTLGKED